MPIPNNVIANADDFGATESINNAILKCFDDEVVNSLSFLINQPGFEHGLSLIHSADNIKQIGVHVNLIDSLPISNFNCRRFLDENGELVQHKTNNKLLILSSAEKKAFYNEICAQINRALINNVPLSHMDSHLHLHTIPCYFDLFLTAAKQFKLKIRLAQTYKENSYYKFYYRKYINSKLFKFGVNYSDRFETVSEFLKNKTKPANTITEVMLHPAFDEFGGLTDHYDGEAVPRWIAICCNRD